MKVTPDAEKRQITIEKEMVLDAMAGDIRPVALDLTYDEAIDTMAKMWEIIRSDGINVAAEVQRARRKIK